MGQGTDNGGSAQSDGGGSGEILDTLVGAKRIS